MEEELTFVPVGQRERAGLAAYAAQLWHAAYDGMLGKEQVDYMTEKFQSAPALAEQAERGYRYYYLCLGKERVGYCGVCPEQGRLFLSKLYLDGAHRGRGLGQRALADVAEIARGLGLPEFYLTVYKGNAPAIRAYERFGCRRTDAVVTDIGGGYVMDDYIYEYAL